MNLFKLSGYLSVAFGALATLLLVNPRLIMISLLLAILGFAAATSNIYLNAKYEITKSNYSMGYIGMMLASLPVIFLMILILRK